MAIENCLGDLKAQVDPLLLNGAFVDKVSAYDQATKDHYILVRGRKGSGKSAIAKMLQKVHEDKGELCEFITPHAFSFAQFDDLYETCKSVPGFPFDYMLREVWSYVIYTTAMKAVLDSKRVAKIARPQDFAAIQEYVRKHELAKKKARADFLKVCDAILGTIKGSGFGHQPGPFDAIGKVLNGALREDAFDALKRVLDGLPIKVYLFIDETDERWDEAKNRDGVIRFLAGMLNVLYGVYFEEYERERYPENLKLKAFVRDEAYSSAPLPNERVMGARTATITWDVSTLFEMICARMGIATGHKEKDPSYVWETVFPRNLSCDPSRHAFHHLLDYTFHRPRDVIDLCQRCIVQASSSHRVDRIAEKGTRIVGKVTEEDINTVVPKYCSNFVDYEVVEAKVVFPECSRLLQLFTGKKWAEKPSYYLKVIEDAAKSSNLPDEPAHLLEKLFQFGFLGAVLEKPVQPVGGHAREQVFWYDNRIIDIMQAERLVVHPAFRVKCSLGKAEDPMAGSRDQGRG